MRVFGLSVLAVVSLLLISAPAQEKEGPITISWYGQSFFLAKSGQGTVVAFDPHQMMQYGRTPGLKADLVLLSHLHNDHTSVSALENAKDKNLKVLVGLDGMGLRTTWNRFNETFKDVRVRSVPTYHDDREGLIRGKNTCFVVEMNGWRICHLGDLGHALTDEQIQKIGPIDVLMIPVGGIYTLNGSEAQRVVAQIKPKEYIFPMHYGTRVLTELLPIDEFLEDQEPAKIAISTDNQVALNKDRDRPRPLIVQLHYAAKNR